MEETIDEHSSFQNPAVSEADPMAATVDELNSSPDPMADTLDENTPYDQSRVKSALENSSPDPMADTLDENTPYDQSRVKSALENSSPNDLEVTLDGATPYDQSRVKSSPQNSSAGVDAQSIKDETPYDQSRVKSSPQNSTAGIISDDSFIDYDPMAVTLPPEQLAALIEEQKEKQSSSTQNEKVDQVKPKSIVPVIVSIFAVTAIAVFFILSSKTPTVLWPADTWKTYIDNHKWMSSYHKESSLNDLMSFKNKDKDLAKLPGLFKDPKLEWLHSIYEKNFDNLDFHSKPTEVVQNLNSKESADKLKFIVQLQADIKTELAKLSVYQKVDQIKKQLSAKKLAVSELNLSKTPTCFELIDTYRKIDSAEQWLTRMKANESLLEKLSKTEFSSTSEFGSLKTAYKIFIGKLNPLSTPLTSDSFHEKMLKEVEKQKAATNTSPTNNKDVPKVKESLLKAPLNEISTMLQELENNFSDQLYAKIDQKILFLQEQAKNASKSDAEELKKLRDKHLLFKRTDIQLSIEVGPAIKAQSRQWPSMSITPNLNCYYAVIYYVNSSEVRIASPESLEDKIIFAKKENKTKAFRRSIGKKVKILCLTYFNDYQNLFELSKVESSVKNEVNFPISELENFIKSVNQKHIAQKTVELQE